MCLWPCYLCHKCFLLLSLFYFCFVFPFSIFYSFREADSYFIFFYIIIILIRHTVYINVWVAFWILKDIFSQTESGVYRTKNATLCSDASFFSARLVLYRIIIINIEQSHGQFKCLRIPHCGVHIVLATLMYYVHTGAHTALNVLVFRVNL